MRHIPNLLCLLRIALTPLCVSLIAGRTWEAALWWTLLAGSTDYWDGWLARRMNWNSPLGAYLDPLADKILLAGCYIALGMAGAVPWWLVSMVFSRDVLILTGVAVVYKAVGRRDFPPTQSGKLSTAIQIMAIVAVLGAKAGFFAPAVLPVAIGAVAAGTLFSGLDYIRVGWHMMKG
ncbi:MAG: CDP-alcohol phosphatidyltransferase family protein [Bryobacterales bacterium]|nr:CDP-alcohol phosphatidyltransferase family protein [Bryobacterales bacterium]